MVVQHNLTAMNSNRMLGVTTSTQAKTTEKLSSGYKINRAADDAAGLAISEKMRKQIRGLTQATANAQDGISAVQTAEGALTEVHDMLQRMNELAVKASNGTQSESDRASIQAEIDQLATEIDRVAETTKFNETYLLKGDRNVEKGYSYSYRAVSKNKAAAATMDQDDATKLTAKIMFNGGEGIAKPAAAADQNAVAKALRDQGITITAKQNADKDGATYSVTLNGSAANIYKINTKNDDGKNTGIDPATKKVNFDAAKTAKFEIVDLQGNKIADIEIAGGIGQDIAAESSKVITANQVEAAENKGDVKQFYDADGNAIAENALGSYFSKLSPEGGARTLYKEDGTPVDDADKLEDANSVKEILYEALKGTSTADLGTITISGVKKGTYMYNGTTGKWEDALNNSITGSITTTKDPSAGDQVVVKGDTAQVANAGTAVISKGESIYDSTGKKLSSEELTAKLALDSKAYEALYSENPMKVWGSYDADGTDKAALTTPPELSGDVALEAGTWTYVKAEGKWTNGTGADQKVMLVSDMKNAISNYEAVNFEDGDTFTVGSGTLGIENVVDKTNDNMNGTPALNGKVALAIGTWTYGGTNWTNGGTTLSANEMANAITNYTGMTFEANDTFDVKATPPTAFTTDPKGNLYTYTPKPATLAGDDVAPQAGKQLYDAVGNALDGVNNKTISMAEAAKEVAANKNLTGALGLNLHVGADATKNNQIDLKIEAMSARGLGINGIRVDGRTDSNALNAIGTIKEALAKVSSQRSQLGAVQNRLEHTINNLGNVVENTTSAESAIRDTDMATTMVQFSNNNILAQAGTSMLAQANQSNQSVLSLLQ